MAVITIRDEKSLGQLASELQLEGFPTRITLRDLIRTRVRGEVARANARQTKAFRSFVCPVEAEVALDGPRLSTPPQLDWESHAKRAEEVFLQNGFFVLVGDHQVEGLDDELDLSADTVVRFVRLVPLVGG